MIYMLEDDGNIRNFVLYALNNSGLAARGFEKPSEFWEAIGYKSTGSREGLVKAPQGRGLSEQETPSLLLLDIMLPEEDGLSVLAKLRSSTEFSSLPVILLTAKGTEYDKVIGLDSGADDYVSKPFGTMELISRVKALLRRSAVKESLEKPDITVGDLSVSPSRHIVTVSGEEVTLTYKEFELLCFLLENMGKVLTRDRILEKVWGYEFDGESRTVDVHIRTLRTKLGECSDIIETVRGIGYKAVSQPSKRSSENEAKP